MLLLWEMEKTIKILIAFFFFFQKNFFIYIIKNCPKGIRYHFPIYIYIYIYILLVANPCNARRNEELKIINLAKSLVTKDGPTLGMREGGMAPQGFKNYIYIYTQKI